MHGRNASAIIAAITIGSSLIGCAAKKDPNPPAPPTGYSQQDAVAQPAAEQPKPAAPVTKPAAAASPAKPAPAPAVPAPVPAAPPQAESPAASGSKTYTIKPGDNLWKISKEVYGDATKYTRIIEANPGLNPDNMKPGTKIAIP